MDVARIARGDVYLVNLDPTVGSEIRKTRPAVVVSPNELNNALSTVIVSPMTTSQRRYPTRVPCRFNEQAGFVALDQIRTLDQSRLLRRLGALDGESLVSALATLREMFED
jgi:mRNA interferase MazF